jgi:nucleoside-diphosphate-sugar epimerase
VRALVIGATGVIGRRATRALLAAGTDVRAIARDLERARLIAAGGAEPVILDVFDPVALRASLRGVDVVVNLATRLPPLERMRDSKAWRENDRIREGLSALLAELLPSAGVGRWVQESVLFVYADGGENWLDETAPLTGGGPISSARRAEEASTRFSAAGGESVILRFAALYAADAQNSHKVAELLLRRRYPVVGRGRNFQSSIHADDAAAAVRAAVRLPAGVYNVADDHPLRAVELTEGIARLLGAPRPSRVPSFVARALAGSFVTDLLTRSLRLSNARFREHGAWAPRYADALEGWAEIARAWSAGR